MILPNALPGNGEVGGAGVVTEIKTKWLQIAW